MLSRIHQKLGTAGFVISIVALIAALGGTAAALTAADKNLIKSESKKFSKQFSKKFAKAGPAGAKGDTGATGATGAPGAAGAAGKDGAAGADGKSPEMSTFAGSKGACTEGGVEFKITPATALACNGKKGVEGPEGSPWTAGGTLPAGKTVTGTFGLDTTNVETSPGSFSAVGKTSISFMLPTTAAPEGIVTESTAPGCPGLTAGVPTADPGKLCVYVVNNFNYTLVLLDPTETFIPGTGKSGAILAGACQSSAVQNCSAHGVWAVTAPTS